MAGLVMWMGWLLGGGCGLGSSSTPAPVDGVAADVTYGPLAEAVATWRGQKAISGEYRSQTDPDVFLGRGGGGGSVLQVSSGTFAYRPPSQFRATGTQKLEAERSTDSMGTLDIDLLFTERTLTMVTRSSMQIPATAQVMRLGPELFDAEHPLKPKTTMRGSPFGQSDVARAVSQMAKVTVFGPPQTVTLDGETFTAHLGETDPVRTVERMVADRSQTMAAVVQAIANEASAELVGFQLDAIARALVSQRHVRVLVDGDGWIRGWDVGPAPDQWGVSMRLSKLKTSVADDAFTLDPALAAQAVDQTPAVVAQGNTLDAAFDDPAAVADVKQRILAAIDKAKTASSPVADPH